jgi:hypothetical protein
MHAACNSMISTINKGTQPNPIPLNPIYLYLYTYTDIKMSFERKKQITFYVPLGSEVLYEKLEEVLKREGKSLSAWIRDQAVNYVRIHEKGNPQLPLGPFVGSGTLPQPVALKPCEYRTHEYKGEFFCAKNTAWGPRRRCEVCPVIH